MCCSNDRLLIWQLLHSIAEAYLSFRLIDEVSVCIVRLLQLKSGAFCIFLLSSASDLMRVAEQRLSNVSSQTFGSAFGIGFGFASSVCFHQAINR